MSVSVLGAEIAQQDEVAGTQLQQGGPSWTSAAKPDHAPELHALLSVALVGAGRLRLLGVQNVRVWAPRGGRRPLLGVVCHVVIRLLVFGRVSLGVLLLAGGLCTGCAAGCKAPLGHFSRLQRVLACARRTLALLLRQERGGKRLGDGGRGVPVSSLDNICTDQGSCSDQGVLALCHVCH